MPNEEHLSILKQGVDVWNEWRNINPDVLPDLRQANLSGTDLSNINFNDANLNKAILDKAILHRAQLRSAQLNSSYLSETSFTKADLNKVGFRNATISHSNLSKSNLADAVFSGTDLQATDFSRAHITGTIFNNVNLSTALGLDTVKHFGPSVVDIATLYRSQGKIPEIFLRGCGMPDYFFTSFSSHFKAIDFYSCFISYSTRDEEFAKKLHASMQAEHLHVWFAPENIKGGQKIFEQIERAIQLYDKLLLVLSKHSMDSEWVISEIRNARRAELTEKKRKFFPIRLVNFEEIKDWKCFDSESGKDLAIEVREYFIPDFTNWKDPIAFETAFEKLIRDLRAEAV